MNIKNFVKKLANKFGYDIQKLNNSRAQRNNRALRKSISQSYLLIHDLGFRPKTVVDVGVANGTQELYVAFPGSYFLLIEPLKDFEPQLKSILKKYQDSYVLSAAGSNAKQVTFNVHPNHMSGSSLYKETMGIEADGYEITVPMIRVDDVLVEKILTVLI